MKKRLCSALLGQSILTRRKYATFFVFCFLFLFGTSLVKAADAKNTPEKLPTKTIVVSAVVPLADEFAYLIRKNSRVVFEKKAFVLGEEGEIRVSIRGGKGEGLRNHRVTGRIFDVHQEEVAFFSGETDRSGQALFHVKFTKQFLGSNTVRVADVTYGEPLLLMEQPHCIVFETRGAKEKAEQDSHRIGAGQTTGAGVFFESSPQATGSDFSEKSATIAMDPLVAAFSRAGPT